MYLAVAGACAEDEANSAIEFADIDGLSLNDQADAGVSSVEVLLSSSEVILSEFGTTNTPAKSYTYSGSIPSFASANDTLNLNITPRSLAFGDDGNYLYVGTNTSSRVYRYTLSTPYDIGTAGSAQNSGDIISVPFQGIALHPDGNKMYVVSGNNLYELALGTNWQISSGVTTSATYDLSGDTDGLGDPIGGLTGIRLSPTGKKLYVSYAFDTSNTETATQGHSKVAQYNLSTAFDASTRSVAGTLDLHPDIGYFSFTPPNPPSQPAPSGVRALVGGLDFSADGTKLYVCSAHADSQSGEFRFLEYS